MPRRVEGGFLVGEYIFEENPRYWIPGRYMRLVRSWNDMRRLTAGPMGTAPLLPHAGGYFDQPGFVMDAFAMFDRWARQGSEDDGGAEE